MRISIAVGLTALCLTSNAAWAQTTPGTPTTAPGGTKRTNPKELDLPFEKPTKEGLTGEVPPPPVPEEQPTPETTPPTFHGEPIPSENSTIFYVIDTSCSMGWDTRSYVDSDGNRRNGDRMARAKVELIRSISSLPESFKFNIIGYGCSIRRFAGSMVQATGANKAAGIAWTSGLYPNDGTMTGPATGAALQDKQNMSVVLLTDGEPNCGASSDDGHRTIIRAANTQRAVVTVFGIGATGALRGFCQAVAADNGGAYIDVP